MIDSLSMEEFLTYFDTEEACVDYLFHIKWPRGFICPRCEHQECYQINSRRLPLYECQDCHHQTSLTVGTVMEGSHTSLRKWLVALFLVSRTSCGINAVELSKIIKVTYKTAWLILHKIRDAISEADTNAPLTGFINVNDVFYGRRPQSTFQRSPHEHPVLVGASMNDPDTPTYIKMKIVPKIHLDEKYVLDSGKDHFINQHTASSPEQIQFTTGPYKAIKHKKLYPYFIQAKRWINNTFHGIGSRYLDSYLNEFCYRVNRNIRSIDIFDSLAYLSMAARRRKGYVSI
jgi:transposase-like protein